ncbi:MAG TPA: NAD-dependent epimerase/dehydratase family protein, partial [Terriglobia bacterium]|nr:NAD-dependent epimerase/dehydratase family protein [Terriglobia bacterium]
MKVLLTGASGFVGSRLSKRLEASGHHVLPVSRRSDST